MYTVQRHFNIPIKAHDPLGARVCREDQQLTCSPASSTSSSDDSSLASFDHAQLFRAMHTSPHPLQLSIQENQNGSGDTSSEDERPDENAHSRHKFSTPRDNILKKLLPNSSLQRSHDISITHGLGGKSESNMLSSEYANPAGKAILESGNSFKTAGLMPGPEPDEAHLPSEGLCMGSSEEGLWQDSASAHVSHVRVQATPPAAPRQGEAKAQLVSAVSSPLAAADALPSSSSTDCSAFFKGVFKGSSKLAGLPVNSSAVSREAPLLPNNTAQQGKLEFSNPEPEQECDTVGQPPFRTSLAKHCDMGGNIALGTGGRGYGGRQRKKPSRGVTWHPNPLQDAPVLKDQRSDQHNPAAREKPSFDDNESAADAASANTLPHFRTRQHAPARVQVYPGPFHGILGVQQDGGGRCAPDGQKNQLVQKPAVLRSRMVREAPQAFTLVGTGTLDSRQHDVDNSVLHL
jgi:hypothetical protein